jgi:RimJ/RimL family protein N-acetyltransferase
MSNIDAVHRKAEFSAFIHHGRGRRDGLCALAAGIELGFERLDLVKVICCVRSDNAPAISLASRAGFQLEGCLRQELDLGDRRVDLLRFGLFRDEWRAQAWRRRLIDSETTST